MEETLTLDPEAEGSADTTVGEDGLTEAERRARAEGRKKHSRPVITIEVDGQTIQAEKVWGSAIFPKDVVRDFNQYCRDTGRKASEICEDILRTGLAPVFADVQATKADRDAARSIRKVAGDEETLIKQAQKLAAKEKAFEAQKAAIRARAKQLMEMKGEGAVDVLAAILGTDETEPATPTNGKTPKGKK